MFNHIGLESISCKPFQIATHKSIFEYPSVIFFRFDNLASEFYSFKAFVGEGVDVDGSGVYKHADGVAVAGVSIISIDISFEQFGVMSFDVLGCDDDFDLYYMWITL